MLTLCTSLLFCTNVVHSYWRSYYLNSMSWFFCLITSLLVRSVSRSYLHLDYLAVSAVILSGFYVMFLTRRFKTLLFFVASCIFFLFSKLYDSDALHALVHMTSIVGQHYMVYPM